MNQFIQLQMLSHEDEASGQEVFVPTTVATETIRNVHPRKYGKTGTRVVFKNGSALPVSDLYHEVVLAWTGQVVDPVLAPQAPVEDDEVAQGEHQVN